MKSEIINVPNVNDDFRRHKMFGLIVLLDRPAMMRTAGCFSGTLVYRPSSVESYVIDGANVQVGHHSDAWVAGYFEPWTGSIQLTSP